jgi:hypothetical protein
MTFPEGTRRSRFIFYKYLLDIYYILSILSTGFPDNLSVFPEKLSEFSEIVSGFADKVVRFFGRIFRENGYKYLCIRKIGTFGIKKPPCAAVWISD